MPIVKKSILFFFTTINPKYFLVLSFDSRRFFTLLSYSISFESSDGVSVGEIDGLGT